MKKTASFHPQLPGPFAALLILSPFVCGHSLAGGRVTVGEGTTPAAQTRNEDSPAWHRRLWEGSFDRASDASGTAARQLDGLEWNCEELREPRRRGRETVQPDPALYNQCVARQQASSDYAAKARSIQKQQKVISLASKAADVAAIGSVGATIYAEMGVKNNSQSYTYEKAANIQKKAGQVSYVTGAADFTMGAYSFIAHKNRLEQMQRTVTGGRGEADAATTQALANAVEASKKAAYGHMLWGAGKLAAGYGMMKLAKRSQDQADRMQSIETMKYYNEMLAARAAQGAPAAAQQTVVIGSSSVPYYQSNQPGFVMPNNGSGGSGLATHSGPVSYTVPGAGTGSSVAPATLSPQRTPASPASAKPGGGEAASGKPGAESGAPGDPAKERNTKEALGSSFETQLTGGPKPFAGSASSSAAATEQVPNVAAMLGNGATDPTPGGSAGTGVSPSQVYQSALEGTDGTEQGSMSGVSGKAESTLFDITREKLTKMFEVGNVGIPRNVEVRN